MTHSNSPSYRARAVFVAREQELNLLLGKYKDVMDGKGLRMLALLGESGVGKTRLVQEFFRKLSTQYDKPGSDGFWGDELGRDGQSLRVNPDFPNSDTDAPMPFFWWGARFPDPGARNSVAGAALTSTALLAWREYFARYVPLLAVSAKHNRGVITKGVAELKKHLRGLRPKEVTRTVIGQIADLTGVPLASSVIQLIPTAFEGLPTTTKEIIDLEKEKRLSIIDQELSALRYIYEDLKAHDLPTVIFLDDTHWGDRDFAIAFLKLMQAAKRGGWPILVVATAWPKEWDDGVAYADRAGRLPGDEQKRVNWIDQADRPLVAVLSALGVERHELKRLAVSAAETGSLAPVLREAFPGLTNEQRDKILQAAEGNPHHLLVIIDTLSKTPAWFEGRDFSKPIVRSREDDFAVLVKKKVNDLVNDLMCAAEEDVKAATAFGSHLGPSFVAEIAKKLAERCQTSVDDKSFDRAMKPYGFLVDCARDAVPDRTREAAQARVYEFAARVYHEVAQKILSESYVSEKDNLEKVLGSVLKEWIEGDALWDGLDVLVKYETVSLVIERPAVLEHVSHLYLLQRISEQIDVLCRESLFFRAMRLAEFVDQRLLPSLENEVSRMQTPDGAMHNDNFMYKISHALSSVEFVFLKMSNFERCIEISNLRIEILHVLKEQAEARGQEPDGFLIRHLEASLAGALANRGAALQSQSRFDEAIASYDEAIALYRALVEERGSEAPPQLRHDLAGALTNRGAALQAQGRLDDAIAAYDEAMALYRALLDALRSEAHPELRQGLARALNNCGIVLRKQGRLADAIASYDEAIALRRGLLEALGSEAPPELRQELAGTLNNRSILLRNQGRFDEAIASSDEAIALYRALLDALGSEAPPELRQDLAGALNNRGSALEDQGRFDEAIAASGEALALNRELLEALGSQAPPELRQELARALNNHGIVLANQGRLDEAVVAFDEAIALRRALLEALGSEAPPQLRQELAGGLTNRGNVLLQLGRFGEAIAFYDEAIALYRALLEALGSEAPPELRQELAVALTNRGILLRNQGRFDEAIASFDEAMALRRGLPE